MYKDVKNGELMRGCNDRNQLSKDLNNSSTYNLGRTLKNIKMLWSEFWKSIIKDVSNVSNKEISDHT